MLCRWVIGLPTFSILTQVDAVVTQDNLHLTFFKFCGNLLKVLYSVSLRIGYRVFDIGMFY